MLWSYWRVEDKKLLRQSGGDCEQCPFFGFLCSLKKVKVMKEVNEDNLPKKVRYLTSVFYVIHWNNL